MRDDPRTRRAMILALALACTWSAPWAQVSTDPDAPSVEDATIEDSAPGADLAEPNRLVLERKYGEAAEVLIALRAEFPDDPDLLLMLGEVLLATGRPAEALEALERSAEIDADRERVQLQLGIALAAAGRDADALAAFERELGNSENTEILVTARLNRSLLLQRAERWSDAAEELESALQYGPDRVQVYADLASLYAEAGRLEDAERAIERGASFGFRSAVHSYSLGARYYREQRYEDAVRLFRASLEVDPERAATERSLAAALEKLGREDEAVEHLRRYLELEPDSPDRERILAQIEAATGN